MIPITQNINYAPCDGFSQITSHIPIQYIDCFFDTHFVFYIQYKADVKLDQRVVYVQEIVCGFFWVDSSHTRPHTKGLAVKKGRSNYANQTFFCGEWGGGA